MRRCYVHICTVFSTLAPDFSGVRLSLLVQDRERGLFHQPDVEGEVDEPGEGPPRRCVLEELVVRFLKGLGEYGKLLLCCVVVGYVVVVVSLQKTTDDVRGPMKQEPKNRE